MGPSAEAAMEAKMKNLERKCEELMRYLRDQRRGRPRERTPPKRTQHRVDLEDRWNGDTKRVRGSQISPPHKERREFRSHHRKERYSPHTQGSPSRHRDKPSRGSRPPDATWDWRLPRRHDGGRDHRTERLRMRCPLHVRDDDAKSKRSKGLPQEPRSPIELRNLKSSTVAEAGVPMTTVEQAFTHLCVTEEKEGKLEDIRGKDRLLAEKEVGFVCRLANHTLSEPPNPRTVAIEGEEELAEILEVVAAALELQEPVMAAGEMAANESPENQVEACTGTAIVYVSQEKKRREASRASEESGQLFNFIGQGPKLGEPKVYFRKIHWNFLKLGTVFNVMGQAQSNNVNAVKNQGEFWNQVLELMGRNKIISGEMALGIYFPEQVGQATFALEVSKEAETVKTNIMEESVFFRMRTVGRRFTSIFPHLCAPNRHLPATPLGVTTTSLQEPIFFSNTHPQIKIHYNSFHPFLHSFHIFHEAEPVFSSHGSTFSLGKGLFASLSFKLLICGKRMDILVATPGYNAEIPSQLPFENMDLKIEVVTRMIRLVQAQNQMKQQEDGYWKEKLSLTVGGMWQVFRSQQSTPKGTSWVLDECFLSGSLGSQDWVEESVKAFIGSCSAEQNRSLWNRGPAEVGDRFPLVHPSLHAYVEAYEHFIFSGAVRPEYTTVSFTANPVSAIFNLYKKVQVHYSDESYHKKCGLDLHMGGIELFSLISNHPGDFMRPWLLKETGKIESLEKCLETKRVVDHNCDRSKQDVHGLKGILDSINKLAPAGVLIWVFIVDNMEDMCIYWHLSPGQEVLVPRLVKDCTRKITLAMAKGASDVGILLKTDIVIGINDFEGVQAAMLGEHGNYLTLISENHKALGVGLESDIWDPGGYNSMSLISYFFQDFLFRRILQAFNLLKYMQGKGGLSSLLLRVLLKLSCH